MHPYSCLQVITTHLDPSTERTGQQRHASRVIGRGHSGICQQASIGPAVRFCSTPIAARTGLPQSYVSESVTRLREQGVFETRADPSDARRTLVRASAAIPRAVTRAGAVPVDRALTPVDRTIGGGRGLDIAYGQ